MSLLSDWWLPATPPTTMSTSISPSQMPRNDRSGYLRSTKLSRSTHAQLSQHISDLKTTTIPGSSNRPGSTSAISTAWRERQQPLRNCTTRCWSSIRTGSILGGRSGVRHAPSSHESDELLKRRGYMIGKIEIERFSLITSKQFDDVVATINAGIGHPEMAEFWNSTHALLEVWFLSEHLVDVL